MVKKNYKLVIASLVVNDVVLDDETDVVVVVAVTAMVATIMKHKLMKLILKLKQVQNCIN